jgi:hypothetical protein
MPHAGPPRSAPRGRWRAGLVALAAVPVAAGYLTGPVVQFPLTFVIPVSLASRHLGHRPRVAFVAGPAARFLVTLARAPPGSTPPTRR